VPFVGYLSSRILCLNDFLHFTYSGDFPGMQSFHSVCFKRLGTLVTDPYNVFPATLGSYKHHFLTVAW